MKNLKDKHCLLKEIKKVIDRAISDSDTNIQFEEDVANLLLDITDKKKVRNLKRIQRELDKWIKEQKEEQKTS